MIEAYIFSVVFCILQVEIAPQINFDISYIIRFFCFLFLTCNLYMLIFAVSTLKK